MTDISRSIAVKPIIKYPREAQVGKTYLMTIDLQLAEGFEWRYEEEEYPIYCKVDSDLFSSKPVGEPVVVLHRFGGSYGEAKFLLRAAQEEQRGSIKVALVNQWGVLVKSLELEELSIQAIANVQPSTDIYRTVAIRNELDLIFAEIEAGKHLKDKQLQTLVKAARAGQISIATGDRAISMGGSSDDAVIVTGDRNLSITGVSAEAIRMVLSKNQRSRNEILLLRSVKEEVDSRLKQSLHNAVLSDISKELVQEQVRRPWDIEIKVGTRSSMLLPEKTNILHIFDDVSGRLLILGNPGSGKTTTALELSRLLLERAEQQPEYPIPVLFNLSSWSNERLPILRWLVKELKFKYGVSSKLGEEWVQKQALLPILDGLDEIITVRQEACINAINQFLSSEERPPYLVVCSRLEEYQMYRTPLQLNGAISLKYLTHSQIHDYLMSLQQPQVWQIVQQTPDLLEFVRTPLMLTLVALSVQNLAIDQWQELTSQHERLHYLMGAYVKHMLSRRFKGQSYNRQDNPTPQQTHYWLTHLARTLAENSTVEFSVEQLSFSDRLQKYQKGLIPWNYSRFLNYATERLLLQRIGKRYRFIHQLLQHYFASLSLPGE
ncbi:NACHT domain-containing protein [Planktothrix sp. FACHB-1355]|uniref:NACHT domain-containing protein n=1 Tax=Aerosakkonema funiforme FACHB-1375 TaxID=2949571 RepID=A0A926VAN0_9CYAN|nr:MULTISPECIES: NACHT domain-containing protein [Oscillatoriales]MBD2180364.1 NACHT domain-containing protein [Aerosakkonema funiforme FACHB-1375]MBD3557504.1 NACHT domain-containing protein [Planktothrix sp. FACHB-1355]